MNHEDAPTFCSYAMLWALSSLPFSNEEGRRNNMELGQWFGVAIMVAMCVGLIVWVVYAMKKDKGKE
jgi:hypothetical protein